MGQKKHTKIKKESSTTRPAAIATLAGSDEKSQKSGVAAERPT
jgi:hypothetical protein